VLHSFGGSRYHNDGAYPDSGLVDVNGTLYGTTFKGGGGYACITETFACGTVFSITTSGTENLLHSFDGHPDGALPTGDLIHVKSALYGTTDFGGKQHHGYGNGTVFSITPEGTEKVLYRFGAGNDGRKPTSGLIEFKGKLYGTTIIGGTYGSTYSCRYSGYCGTVFSITLGGRETVLHNFGSGADGAGPHASLLVLNGNLYGTTYAGGTYGKGTVFTITPGGAERVLYSFSGANDGGNPRGELIDVNGTLYGTASTGGVHGDGVVFSLTPSL
jgi:uncharacterized repeat protein (TIGR03803 family)